MSSNDDLDDEDEPGLLQRYRIVVIIVALVVVGAGVFFVAKKLRASHSGPVRVEKLTIVSLPPPPPPAPPPPPPPPPPPMEQKMIEQTPVDQEEKPEPKDEPPSAPPATGIVGNGPADGFGLGKSSGNWLAKGSGAGNRTNSKWGWYAGQVQTKIQDSLRNNRATRSANLRTEVRVWLDSTGRSTRVQLTSSAGTPALDAALKESLTGLQLSEPPPPGMPMPIVIRVTARRPT